MKVLAVNGSPHREGNIHKMIMKVFTALEAESIETDFAQVGGKMIRPHPPILPISRPNSRRLSITPVLSQGLTVSCSDTR